MGRIPAPSFGVGNERLRSWRVGYPCTERPRNAARGWGCKRKSGRSNKANVKRRTCRQGRKMHRFLAHRLAAGEVNRAGQGSRGDRPQLKGRPQDRNATPALSCPLFFFWYVPFFLAPLHRASQVPRWWSMNCPIRLWGYRVRENLVRDPGGNAAAKVGMLVRIGTYK